MSKPPQGKRVPLSPARRMVVELMRHAQRVPSLPIHAEMNVAPLMAARAACANRPSWVGLFLKAFSLAARDIPELRRAYIPWPRPHLYEHPFSSCAVLIERDWDGEKAVLAAKIRGPENQTIPDIDHAIRRFASDPLEQLSDLRQLTRIARYPDLLRRFIFWSTLYLSGATRAKRFGTFMVSTLGNLGVEQTHPITPLTSYLSFGPLAADGRVTTLLVYDHRVMDGRRAARALKAIERELNGTILAELQQTAKAVA